MTADQVLSEFIDAWNAGRRPAVDAYLERVASDERDAFADKLGAWLSLAPVPDYAPAMRTALSKQPSVLAAVAFADGEGELAAMVTRLRRRAGLAVSDLAARIVEVFGLPGEEARAAAYLEQLEGGELDATRVSRRLLDALGRTLRSSGESLMAAAGPPEPIAATGTGTGATFFRTAGLEPQAAEDIEALSLAALSPAPEPAEELDRLFQGGRNA